MKLESWLKTDVQIPKRDEDIAVIIERIKSDIKEESLGIINKLESDDKDMLKSMFDFIKKDIIRGIASVNLLKGTTISLGKDNNSNDIKAMLKDTENVLDLASETVVMFTSVWEYCLTKGDALVENIKVNAEGSNNDDDDNINK